MGKKFLALTVVLILVAGLVAIGCAPKPAPTPAPAPAPKPAPAQPAAVIHWTAQSAFPAADPQHQLGMAIADRINKACGGRLVIDQVAVGGAIVPAGKELDGLRTGALDWGYTCATYNKSLHNAFPLFAQVAGGLSSLQRIFWMTDGGGQQLAEELCARFGATFMTYIALPPEDWGYTNIPLNTLDDLKKLKMRTAGDPGEVLGRLGASTVFLPGGQLYESMQRGVINSFEYGAAKECYENKFHEVFKYLYQSPSRAPCDENSIIVRTESFNKLTDDLKAIVREVCQGSIGDYYGPCIVGDALALQKIIDYGIKVQPLPKQIEDAVYAEAQKFYDEKMKTEDELYVRILKSMRDFQKYCVLKQISG